MAERKYSLSELPPWVVFPHFADPVITYLTLPFSSQAIQLCDTDASRWSLWVSANAVFSVSPDPLLATGTKPGITVSQTTADVFMSLPTHGSLVGQAWYGVASGPAPATVISVSVKTWPDGTDPMDDMMRRSDRTPRIVKPQPLANIPGPPGRPSLWDYWMSLIGRKKPPT